MQRLGEAPTIHPTARVRDCTLGRWTEIEANVAMAETSLGDYSYVVHGTEIIYATIGKFCSIAAHARINPGNHPLDRAALPHFTYRATMFDMGQDDEEFFGWRRSFPMTLGNDVWIGHGAVVLPGVSVGTGAAVGANAVVSRDVPDFAVVAGVPARILRYRFPEPVRDALLRLAWWDWDHATLGARLPDFRALGARRSARSTSENAGARLVAASCRRPSRHSTVPGLSIAPRNFRLEWSGSIRNGCSATGGRVWRLICTPPVALSSARGRMGNPSSTPSIRKSAGCSIGSSIGRSKAWRL